MMPLQRSMKVVWTALVTAACGLLVSCATTAVIIPEIPPLKDHPVYDIESVDLLDITTEMRQFVDAHLEGRNFDQDRAWALAYAMLDPWLLDFEYDPQVTLTASEAFRTRQGNCLTFSNMFIAMARDAGLDAWYREVEIAPQWSSIDDTLLVSMHVNAATAERGKQYVVDVSRRRPREGETVRRLSDRDAEAHFYNNLGADALVANDLPMAYAYFRKALQTNNQKPFIWANLGVVYRRNEQTADAMLAYQTALQIEDDHAVAMNNLYTLYEQDGHIEKAQALQGRVERNRRRNPYYLHYLAQVAIEEKNWDEAAEYASRAIRLQKGEYRFHYTLAQSLFQAGRVTRAKSSLTTAKSLAPDYVDMSELTLPGELPRPSES